MIRKIACIVGQSNEKGHGLLSDSSTNGCPLRDPVAPYGSTLRSMWPRLAEMMAARNVWLNITNTAHGSTSLTASASGAGLQSDRLHMNDPALNLASEAWYSALIATGRF